MVGRRFGPYEVTRLIGVGGMGSVYQAERVDRQYAKKVAIKVVSPAEADPKAVSRFIDERQTLAALDHPNIVKLLDGGVTEDGLPYLVMDYVEGIPINEYADKNKLGVSARLKLFLQVASAVEYAHRSLIVHRDIKPRNILVASDGVPKLLDFGIAKLIRSKEKGGPESLEATLRFRTFTLEYASPEQVRAGPITTSVDVYALGMLLYELLTGRWPFVVTSKSELALAYAICETKPEPVSVVAKRTEEESNAIELASQRGRTPESLSKRLAGDLDAIASKAISKAPEQRYESVSALADDVQRHLKSLTVLARPQSAQYRLHRFAVRNKGVFIAGSLALVIAIAGVVGIIRQSQKTEAQRALAERRFEDLKGIVGTFLFDVHDNIKDLPGSTHVRAMLLDKTSRYLGWLSTEAKDDAALQLDLADSYIKIARTQGDPFEMNLGKTKDALDNFERAQRAAEGVLAKDPKNTRAKRYLALVQLNRASILEQQGKSPEALTQVKAARATFQQIALLQPKSAEAHADLASSHDLLAIFYARTDPNVAIQNLQDALDEDRTVIQLDPNNFPGRRAIPILKMRMGDLRSTLGDVDRANKEYQESSDALDQLYKDTKREDLRRLRATLHGKIATTMVQAKNFQAAIEGYGKQQAILEEILRVDPNESRTLMDVAAVLKNKADTYWYLNDMPAYLASSKGSLEILQKLTDKDPSNQVVKERLASMLMETADAMVENKQHAEAKTTAARGLDQLSKLANSPNASPFQLYTYAESLLTCQPEELRNPKAALPYAEKAVEQTKAMHFVYVDTLAKAAIAAGDKARAVKVLEDALSKLPIGSETQIKQVLENRLAEASKESSTK